jgi:hypothetical protein
MQKSIRKKDIEALVAENHRRMEEIFGTYDPLTGEGCYDFEHRTKLEIKDFFIPTQYVPKEVMDSLLIKKIVEHGSIKKFIEEVWQKEWTRDLADMVSFEICKARFPHDPEFAMYITDKIVDKKTGNLINFRLNYPQRRLLKLFEDLRHARKPIFVVLLKARQWGGSTLTQLYIKWMQDFVHPDGWNSIIVAQTKDTSRKIKKMYKTAIEETPGWTVGCAGKSLQFSPFEGSMNDFNVTDGTSDIRSATISIASYENITSVRGSNFHCAHYSEVAYWKKTQEQDPEEVISSVTGGLDPIPDNIEVYESTGRGASGFFYDLCQTSRDTKNNDAYSSLFVPFYWIEKDMIKVEDEEEFARWLLENKDVSTEVAGYRESGKFFWRLWNLGSTFDSINWYRKNRNRFRTHASMATEAPVDADEAFRNSGNLVFNPYYVDELETQYLNKPACYADIDLIGRKGKAMIRESKIRINENAGEVKIWQLPNNRILKVKDRYVVAVDIGGRAATSDYSVFTVIDRKGMIKGLNGKPEIVARYRGHCRHDILAWKAAVLAHYYDDALLVIESNTADREKNNNTEGDHFGSIVDEIAGYYKNMYMRVESPESVTEKVIMKFGFQTNKLTKQWIIDNMISCVEDKLWIEPDSECYHEMRIYVRNDDGSMGNIQSRDNHDDVVMSTAIGLWVSMNEMDLPTWAAVKKAHRYEDELTEASM